MKPKLSHLECTGMKTKPPNTSNWPEQRVHLETACEKRRLPQLAGNVSCRDSRKQRLLRPDLLLPASGSYSRRRRPDPLAVHRRPKANPAANPAKHRECATH